MRLWMTARRRRVIRTRPEPDSAQYEAHFVKRISFVHTTLLVAGLASSSLTAASAADDSNWPSFRGRRAAGVASAPAALSWGGRDSQAIRWRTDIPGLGHSSPIIWGDRIFLTTAVSDRKNPRLRIGLYGDIDPINDGKEQEWRLYSIDRGSGAIEWMRAVKKGLPQIKRHPKSTHANSTPATDGKHVVAFFGSEGLYTFDMQGTLLWKKDLGVLDSAFFRAPEAQWGFGSSPIIHDGRVIVQCDVLENSFLAAFDLETGKEIWRTARDEVPTWSTPTIDRYDGGARIIVNGYRQIGGYDFETGALIWNMQGGGDIPVPTPIVGEDLVYVTNSHGGAAPIYAIRRGATGDIAPAEDGSANPNLAWSTDRHGAYMTTPLLLEGTLYVLRDNGALAAFDATTFTLRY